MPTNKVHDNKKFIGSLPFYLVLLAGSLAIFSGYIKSTENSKFSFTNLLNYEKTTEAEDTKTTHTLSELNRKVDTSTWPTYQDSKYNFKFKFSPNWTIRPKTVGNIYLLAIQSKTNPSQNIKIFITKDGYFATDGLKLPKTTINGVTAVNLDNILIGMKQSNNYYTFDAGTDINVKPEFVAMVNSVSFK